MAFFKERLSNGAIFMGDIRKGFPATAVIGIPRGSVHDRQKLSGEAHFLEHMVFKSKANESVAKVTKRLEAIGGNLNAGTDFTSTIVHNSVSSRHAELGMDCLLELTNSNSFLPHHLKVERRVILEEIDGAEDNILEYVDDRIPSILFLGPYAQKIRGEKESVRRCTTESLKEVWRNSYSPSKFMICITGQSDREAIRRILEERLSSHTLASKPAFQQNIPIANKYNTHLVEKREGMDQARVVFATHAPTQESPLMDALEVLDCYLTNGFFSELFLEIREKRGLAYKISGELEKQKFHGKYSIHVPTSSSNTSRVLSLIKDGFRKATSIDSRNIKKIKEKLIGSYEAESPDMDDLAVTLIDMEMSGKPAEEFYKRRDRINAVTARQVRYVAEQALNHHSTLLIMPR